MIALFIIDYTCCNLQFPKNRCLGRIFIYFGIIKQCIKWTELFKSAALTSYHYNLSEIYKALQSILRISTTFINQSIFFISLAIHY